MDGSPATAVSLPAASWQERRTVAYPLLVLLAVVLVTRGPLGPTVIHGDLTIHWVWADQFTNELARGQIYPRWMPASDAGLGTPVFYFYPPIAFYLTAIFGSLGASTYASLICAFGTAFAASGIGCWHWLKGRSNYPLLASAFFMAAPYHLFNYADRAALPESVAIAIIPLLAIGLRRIAEGRGGIAATAVAYAAMIGTHLPLALLVSLFLIAPYALLHRERFVSMVLAVAAGIGLAAIYLLPALALAPYRDVGQLYRTPNFHPEYWSIFAGNWNDVSYTVTFLIAGAIGAAALLPAIRRRDPWAIHAIAVAVIVTGVVPLIWSLPLLRAVQFPFRALPIAEFALATALANLPRKPLLEWVPMALPLLVSLMVLPVFTSGGADLQRLRGLHPDAYEYLPRGVMAPGQTSASLSDILATRIPPPQVPGMVVEPHFYFPSWSCGTPEPRTQLLMHEPSCTPRIVWTWQERLGAAISLLTGLALTVWALARRGSSSMAREPLATFPVSG